MPRLEISKTLGRNEIVMVTEFEPPVPMKHPSLLSPGEPPEPAEYEVLEVFLLDKGNRIDITSFLSELDPALEAVHYIAGLELENRGLI